LVKEKVNVSVSNKDNIINLVNNDSVVNKDNIINLAKNDKDKEIKKIYERK